VVSHTTKRPSSSPNHQPSVSTRPKLLANDIKCGYNKKCKRKRVIRAINTCWSASGIVSKVPTYNVVQRHLRVMSRCVTPWTRQPHRATWICIIGERLGVVRVRLVEGRSEELNPIAFWRISGKCKYMIDTRKLCKSVGVAFAATIPEPFWLQFLFPSELEVIFELQPKLHSVIEDGWPRG
jgi:hypothetical protein